ncbi:MAG TPA: C25 family cysteine peptidase, partial [Candidatus Cloacimonadota bacterium]|nr:C25 family cysteine peptidase [Candidatus Cloacimonadota bacterium]
YIEWKKQKGYRVAYKTIESIEASYTGDDVCLYPINDTPGKIRQYLREKKNNTPLEYVLIVGGLEDDSDNQSSTNNNATNPTVRYSVAGNFDSVYAWRNMGKDFPSIVDKGRKNQAGSDHYFANLSDDWNSFIEPPWHQIDSPYTDGDFYGTYHDTITTGIDLKVGRLIANRENQVHNFTDKVIKYETYNHPNNFNTIGHINYNQFQTPSAPGNWVLNEDPLPNHGSIEDFYQNSFNSNLTIISGSAFAWKCLHLLNNTIIKSYSDDSYIGLPTCNLNNGYGFDSISELSHGILAFTASHCDGSFFQTGNNGTGQDHVDLLTGKRSFVEAWTCSFSGQGGPVAIASSGSMFFPTQYPPNLTPDKTARQNLVNNFTSSSNLHNVFSLFKSDLYVYDMNIANIVRTLNYYGDPVLRTWVNTPILYSIQLNPYNYSINLVDENNNPAAHVKTVFLTDNSSQIITETNPSGCAFANQPFRSVTISGDNVIPITVRIIGNYTELSGDLDSNTIYYIPSGNTVSISSDLNLKGKGHFGSQIIVAEGATLSISNNVIINGELKSSPNKRGNSIYIFGNLNIGSNVVFTGEMDNMVLNNTGHNAFNAVSFEGVTLENYSNLSLLNSSFSQASLIHNSGNLTLNNVSGYESNGIGLHITKADSVLINNTNFVSNKIGASINNIRAVLNISNSNFSYNDLGIEISNTQYYCSNINNSTFSNNEY